MEDLDDFGIRLFLDCDEEEEEFRSCLAEEDELRDLVESVEDGPRETVDEFVWKMFFKGISIREPNARLSGIGVVMERTKTCSVHLLQKKLEFDVEEPIAEYLALMDGLVEASKRDVRRVFAFTDSEIIYDQIVRGERLENKLVSAFRERILEHTNKLESFILELAPSGELKKPLLLAQEAVGLPLEGNGSVENCPFCCEEKKSSQMVRMKCSHRFCSSCMIKYVDGKIQFFQVPIRCPQMRCKYYISAAECKSFLPDSCYESLERALMEADIPDSGNMYCPYPNCSALLNTHQCLSTRASSSSQSESQSTCAECPDCQRLICIDCGEPWHALMSCQEYQDLPIEERDAEDITLHHLAQNQRWRQCPQCRRMIELVQGCNHMTCWCGLEFCYACGVEYRDGQQTCQCAFWDDDDDYETLDAPSPRRQDPEPWRWDSFDSLPDAYSDQERSQLALIQRFLAGGFSLSDHQTCQSPPRCSDTFIDTIKDLHQLPWLERFVSVISDNYYDDYVQ